MVCPKKELDTLISVIFILEEPVSTFKECLLDIREKIVQDYDCEVILINNNQDYSFAQSLQELTQNIPELKILVLANKLPTDSAIIAGLDSAIGDYALVINPNTYSSKTFDFLFNPLVSKYDITNIKTNQAYKLLRGGLTRMMYWLLKKFFPYRDFFSNINYSIGVNRRAINLLTKIRRKRLNIDYISGRIGLRKKVYMCDLEEKQINKIKKEDLVSFITKLMDIGISHSLKPLRFATIAGLSASVLSFLYVIYIFVVSLLKEQVAEGWISTSLLISGLFLILFIILSIMSEYLLRILHESRDEPSYFIYDETDSTIFTKDYLNIK